MTDPIRCAPARKPQLVCPAGSLRALQLAVDAGADAVYMGLKDATNARNFAGLNFDRAQAREAIRYAHARGAQVLMALNTFADARAPERWRAAVDIAAEIGADALICADAAVLAYARDHHPALRLHLSVQASATSYEAIEFYREQYGIRRAVLPRVLTLSHVGHLVRNTQAEIEVFGFGSLCVMVEGRCALSSYVTGCSPNNAGVCSPAAAVRWQDTRAGVEARLNDVLIDCFAPDEPRGYPTLCKGRFMVGAPRAAAAPQPAPRGGQESLGAARRFLDDGVREYAIEEPTSLNTMALLPQLMALGIAAIKIEGRQRSAAYVEQVTRVWRQAIDACAADPEAFAVQPAWTGVLARHAEGQQHTLGAYDRPWR